MRLWKLGKIRMVVAMDAATITGRSGTTIDPGTMARARCPACAGSLVREPAGTARQRSPDGALLCEVCGASYPVVKGIPVLVDEDRSLFHVADCVATAARPPRTWWGRAREAAQKVVPSGSTNLAGAANVRRLAAELHAEMGAGRARVLILGGATLGVGTDVLVRDPSFAVVESDVVIGPRTNLVCDAHDVPFEDGTFDAVIAQAVLEYMIDPFRVASEIHRVLRPRGLVYAESPFMQQVHGGPYDFFRFTHLGHRRVLRWFEEVDSGVACGPAMALSWAHRYFLRSFARSPGARAAADMLARALSGWLTVLDRSLREAPGAYDAASAFYFLGRKSEAPVADREITAGYRGMWRMFR